MGGASAANRTGRQILIADFNGDRRNDIFVADHGYDVAPFSGHANALALSTAAGKLVDASANLPPESGFSHSAAAADVNRDGALDLYIGNMCCGDTPPEILLNDGSGRFSRAAGFCRPSSRAHTAATSTPGRCLWMQTATLRPISFSAPSARCRTPPSCSTTAAAACDSSKGRCPPSRWAIARS